MVPLPDLVNQMRLLSVWPTTYWNYRHRSCFLRINTLLVIMFSLRQVTDPGMKTSTVFSNSPLSLMGSQDYSFDSTKCTSRKETTEHRNLCKAQKLSEKCEHLSTRFSYTYVSFYNSVVCQSSYGGIINLI